MLNKLTPKQKKDFQININTAFELAMVADGFLARAENTIREAGAYRIDVKKNMDKAVK